MWLTRWPEQRVITLQPKAKATRSMFSSRTMAISLQCKIENVLHSYAGTLLFPVPAFPTANTEWHSAGSSSSWTTYHTEGIHSERLSSPVVLLITETKLFTRVISPSYTPIPFNRKKMNLHLLSRFASADLMLHQATLSDFQKMGREFASINECSYLNKWEQILFC